MLILPMLLGAFQPPKPAQRGPLTVFPFRTAQLCFGSSGGGEKSGVLYWRPLVLRCKGTCSARTALDGAQRITDLYCQCLGSPVNQHRRMRS
jgi:hypothetical protein